MNRGLKAPKGLKAPVSETFNIPLSQNHLYAIKAFHNLPPIVKFFCRKLLKLAKKDKDEHGYTIYQRGDDFYIQQDQGSPFLTVSDFSPLTGDKLLFVLKPDIVYLLHSHPFSSHPMPSLLDLQTAVRFRDFYRNVVCVVVGRRGYAFY